MHSKDSYVLLRVKQDGSSEQVSEHRSFESGWSAGQSAVHEDRDHAYSLHANGRRVAKFGHSRLMPRRSSFDWSVIG